MFEVFHKRGIHILHLNIRSLLSKIDELRYIAIKSKATIICITETWLDETVWDPEISIPEYNQVFCLGRFCRARRPAPFW